MTTLLAIETSCDETGVAVLQQQGEEINVLAQALASQVNIHALTGGVVPDVAAREHAAVIAPLIKKVLADAGMGNAPLTPPAGGGGLGGIAVTVGPGLAPALALCVSAAQTLSYAWQKPIVPVHHLEGHVYSALLTQTSPTHYSLLTTNWPALALIVSGGHTQLILVRNHLDYTILGSTRDDAAGEAFDKVARLLGLGYPGGPAISNIAKEGNPQAFNFTRPMLRSGDLDFSFSGLKTEVLYKVRELKDQKAGKQPAGINAPLAPPAGGGGLGGVLNTEEIANVAASFQAAAVDSLVAKTIAAAQQTQPAQLLLAGGVAANQLLRQQLQKAASVLNLPLKIAPLELCGDNAVMIGLAGLLAYAQSRTTSWEALDATARTSLENFSANAVANG